MNRRTAMIAIALLLCASAARAQDIETATIDQTQRCIYTVLTSQWAVDHDPVKATNLAVAVCEPNLVDMARHFHPDADKALIHMRMIEEARRQLHIIAPDGLGE